MGHKKIGIFINLTIKKIIFITKFRIEQKSELNIIISNNFKKCILVKILQKY